MKFNNRLTDEIYTSDTEKLGVQAYRFCAPQSCGHSNGEYVGWSPNRVTPLNMGL